MLSLKKTLAIPILFSALLAGCHSKTGGGALATAPITPATGGTLTVTTGALAGLVLEIPPNSVAADITVTVNQGSPSDIPGRIAVGPVATFGPAGTTFDPAATLSMPFSLPGGGASEEDIGRMVAMRNDATGDVVEVEALFPIVGEIPVAVLDIDHFSSFWVTSDEPPPPPLAVALLSDYLPLNVGDIYQLEEQDGAGEVNAILTLRIQSLNVESTGENVPGATFRILANLEGESDGEYFSLDSNGDLITHGYFDITENSEEVFVTPLVFAPAIMTIGTTLLTETDVNEHAPIGDPTVRFTSHSFFETFFGVDIVAEDPVSTPAGVFDDVVFVGRIEDNVAGMFSSNDQTLFAFARDVGFIGIEFDEDDFTRIFLLRGAVVGGVAIGQPINTDF